MTEHIYWGKLELMRLNAPCFEVHTYMNPGKP